MVLGARSEKSEGKREGRGAGAGGEVLQNPWPGILMSLGRWRRSWGFPSKAKQEHDVRIRRPRLEHPKKGGRVVTAGIGGGNAGSAAGVVPEGEPAIETTSPETKPEEEKKARENNR